MSETEEKTPSTAGLRRHLARVAGWFFRLPAIVKGIITTVEFGLAVGCIWAAWTAGGDMELIIPALALGLFFGIIGIATIPDLKWRSKAVSMALASLLFVGIGGFLYWHFRSWTDTKSPISTSSPLAPKQPSPQLVSTYQKLIVVCSELKPDQGASKKQRQDQLDKYIDLMQKVFGYTVKAKVEEHETTLEVTPNVPIGNPSLAITKQTYFLKRSGDQLFVTVTNEFIGPLVFMLQLARPDATEDFSKSIITQIEKLTAVEPNTCKLI